MKKIPLILATSAMLIYGCGNDKGPKTAEEASKDSANAMKESMDHISDASVDFATAAASANVKEIELGKLALKNGDYHRLKEFGQKMIDAHTKANDDLQKACYTAGVTVPAGLSKADQEDVNKMAEKKDKDFDKAYIKAMVKEHQQAMERLDAAAHNMKDTALQNYAKKALPAVSAHLDEARNLLEDVRKQYRPEQFDDVESYQ
jgi:putative membrane protein